MRIIDLWVYIITELSKAEFFIIIFGLLCVISVFGLIDRKLK